VKLGDKSVEHTTAVSKKCAKQEACRELLVDHLGLDPEWLVPPQTQAIVSNATGLTPLRSMLDRIAQPNMPTSPLATLHALCMKCHGVMPVYSFEKTAQNQMNCTITMGHERLFFFASNLETFCWIQYFQLMLNSTPKGEQKKRRR
jgi:hypothetical protein